jgi:hypothetical protein
MSQKKTYFMEKSYKVAREFKNCKIKILFYLKSKMFKFCLVSKEQGENSKKASIANTENYSNLQNRVQKK